MRIVTWNMGCAFGSYRGKHDQAWLYLLEELQPDVALVQESLLQASLLAPRRGRSFARSAWGKTQDWASGIHVVGLPAEEIDFDVCEGVHAVAVRLETASGPVTAVSVHVSTGDDQEDRLTKFADVCAEHGRAERMIIGGDFNAARLFDKVYPGQHDFGAFFDGMERRGFSDCHWRIHGRENRTFWRQGDALPYQDDHLFVSETLAPRVRRCVVVDDEWVASGNPPTAVAQDLSDHGPVLLELDL